MHDHEDAASAMLFLALAKGATPFADAGAKAHSGVLKDRNGTEQNAGKKGNQKCEEQDAAINANFTNPWKSRGSDGRKDAQRGVSEAQADRAAEQS